MTTRATTANTMPGYVITLGRIMCSASMKTSASNAEVKTRSNGRAALSPSCHATETNNAATLDAFVKQQGTKHLLLSDFRRSMLPAWGALETNEQSPIYRYARRAYFV